LTLNTVYYLSKPVENIPYEYYLAFCDQDLRNRELKNSVAWKSKTDIVDTSELNSTLSPGGLGLGTAFADALLADAFDFQQNAAMKIEKNGVYKRYTHVAVPLCQGDYYVDPETDLAFRCVGTTPSFFTDLLIDADSEEKFSFAQGRCFVEKSPEHGFFECVVGSVVANRCGIKLGDKLQATHGDPNESSAHIHEQDYTVVGIVKGTGTPNDRVVFLNMEGFYLMEDHSKNMEDDSVLSTDDDEEDEVEMPEGDLFPDEDDFDTTEDELMIEDPMPSDQDDSLKQQPEQLTDEEEFVRSANATRIPLPIEQREVTSIVVRTSLKDKAGLLPMFLPSQINQDFLNNTLDWTPYRPEQAQVAAQAVNPVMQVTSLFETFVNPIRWLLLALTAMICVVSALSILVGIYNSMSQRQNEIAVMRALGAGRSKVMMIMLCEAVMLALLGGLLGWVAGHGLNAALSPLVEAKTGVTTKFLEFAPPVQLNQLFLGTLPDWIGKLGFSTEFMLIPGLMILAVAVGIYPAISAYKTDVSKSLGK